MQPCVSFFLSLSAAARQSCRVEKGHLCIPCIDEIQHIIISVFEASRFDSPPPKITLQRIICETPDSFHGNVL